MTESDFTQWPLKSRWFKEFRGMAFLKALLVVPFLNANNFDHGIGGFVDCLSNGTGTVRISVTFGKSCAAMGHRHSWRSRSLWGGKHVPGNANALYRFFGSCAFIG